MQVLEEGKKIAAEIGIYLRWPEVYHRYNFRCLSVLLLFILFSGSSTAFIVFDASTYREYEDAFFAWISVSFTCVGFLINVIKSVDILLLIDDFESICEMHIHDPTSKSLYNETNDKINKWTRIMHTAFLKVTIPVATVPVFFISYFLYYTTELKSDAFFIPSYTKLPVNRTTPIGFGIAYVIQGLSLTVVCHTVIAGLSLLFAFFGMMMSFGHNLQRKFHELNQNYITDRNDWKLSDDLYDVIEFYSRVKMLSAKFMSVIEFTISLYYIWSILAICDTLLMCRDIDDVKFIFIPMVLVFWSFALIFLFSELGQRLTKRFIEINSEILDYDWYAFPLSIQKMIPTILASTQDPVVITGFGNIQCTRETFKNVVTAGFSYCAMLQRVQQAN